MTAPRIAMPARLSDSAGGDARIALANAIFDDVAALVRAEGLEVVVVKSPDVTGFDGVVLPGGGDVDPARYNGDTAAPVYDVNPVQDALDFEITAAACAAGLPVLGVCRGLQVINVAFGGTLVEDLPATGTAHRVAPPAEADRSPAPDTRPVWAWHPVALADARLRAAYGAEEITVASAHHQAIDRLASDLRVTARAADGTVEAVEHHRLPVIAVQWHPEAGGTPSSDAATPFRLFAEQVRARP